MSNKMDYNFFKQMLTLSILNIVLISFAYGKDGECYTKSRNGNERSYEKFCCAHYEKKNGTCIACEKGYVSKGGGSCTPCPGNGYGDQCVHTCSCTKYQICNHVLGCTDFQSSRIDTTLKDETVSSKDGETNESINGTAQSILIYSMCVASFVVVITLSCICIKRTRSKRINQRKEQNREHKEIQNVPNLVLPSNKTMIGLESIYDEIDEVIIHVDDDPLSNRHTNTNTELSSDEISESDHDNIKNEDYLNPYQPIVQELEKHEYETVPEFLNNEDKLEHKSCSHKSNEENLVENAIIVHECPIIIDQG